jgi:L-lactate dehydrogenase
MKKVISIVGFGNIGKVICALLLPYKEYNFTLNIVDIDPNVKGAITDFEHGNQLYPNHTLSHNNEDLLNNSDFIFHCAGASVPKGKSRLHTCQQSVDMTEAIFKNFKPTKTPFIIVVANPVDIISTITYKLTGLPANRIIGTGTFLDSIRMNHVIEKMRKDVTTADAIILGEHGTTAFLSKHLSSINGLPFSDFIDDDALEHCMTLVKNAAEEIKSTQDVTIYGVSYCAIQLFEMLLSEEGRKVPVSTLIPEALRKELGAPELFLSLYSTINQRGAFPVEDYRPDAEEMECLRRSLDLILPCFPTEYL